MGISARRHSECERLGYIFVGEGGEAESSFLHVLVFISDRKIYLCVSLYF